MDTINPLTISLDKDQSYLNHPFECPLTDKEAIVKTKLEESYSTSLESIPLETKPDLSEEQTNEGLEGEAEEIKDPIEELSESQLAAIKQIEELFSNRLISEQVYTQEIKAIKKRN